jgi:hypothetical protein
MASPRAFVLGMVAVWGATGLIEPHTPNAGQPFNEIGFVQIIVWAVLIFGWVKAHSRSKQIEPPTGASIFAALLPPLGVPYYAFGAFGAREGVKLVGLSLLALIAMLVLYTIMFELSVRLGA